MLLEKFLIRAFSDEDIKPVYTIKVPVGSIFTGRVKCLHDGIYVFYNTPELITGEDGQTENFKILQPKEPIPDTKDAILVDILDLIFEMAHNTENAAEPTQGIMLFPVYKLL